MSHNNLCSYLNSKIQREIIDFTKETEEILIEPTIEEKEYIPSENKQFGKVTVKGVSAEIDKNIKPENIKLGVSILGVDGNVAPDKPDQEKSVVPTIDEQVVLPDTGFELSKVIVNGVPTEQISITENGNFTPTYGKFFSSVNVNVPVPNLSLATATEEDVIIGKTFFSGNQDIKTGKLELLTKTVSENGTYTATDEGVAGWGKIIVEVGGEQTVEVELPSVLANQSMVYYVLANNDKILFSSDASNCGLWLYTISIKSMTQIYASGQRFQYFMQKSPTQWFIGAYNTQGILLYNTENDYCEKIYSTNNQWQYLQQVTNNKWLIGSGSKIGVLVYNSEDNSFKKINTSIGKPSYFKQVTNNKWLISCSQSETGIFLYNSEDDSFIQIYTKGDYWQYFHQINDTKWLISGTSYSVYGILQYNSQDDSIELIYNNGYNYEYFQQVSDNKYLISSNNTDGVFLYNSENNSFTQIYTSSTKWKFFQQITSNKWLIGNNTTNSTASYGLLLYNSEDDSITKIYSLGGNYDIFTLDVNNNYYISSSDKSVNPRKVYYTESTNTVTLISYSIVL